MIDNGDQTVEPADWRGQAYLKKYENEEMRDQDIASLKLSFTGI